MRKSSVKENSKPCEACQVHGAVARRKSALGLSGFCGKKWLRTAAKEVIKHDNESFPQRCRVREQLKLEGAAVWALRVKASLLAVWIGSERLWLGDARPGPPALESLKKALRKRLNSFKKAFRKPLGYLERFFEERFRARVWRLRGSALCPFAKPGRRRGPSAKPTVLRTEAIGDGS